MGWSESVNLMWNSKIADVVSVRLLVLNGPAVQEQIFSSISFRLEIKQYKNMF